MSTRALELSIAWRYLRSRRGSRLLSFITVIAMGGVIVGVSALVVIMGVMNGLQTDLREKILVASPDIRVLNFGEDLRISDWRAIQGRVAAQRGQARDDALDIAVDRLAGGTSDACRREEGCADESRVE